MRIRRGWLLFFGVVAALVILAAVNMASYHLCLGPYCMYSDPVDKSPLQIKMIDDTPNPLYVRKPPAVPDTPAPTTTGPGSPEPTPVTTTPAQ